VRFWITLSFVVITIAPVLLLLAWTTWVRQVRSRLAHWRNALSFVALFLPSLNWCGGAWLNFIMWTGQSESGAAYVVVTGLHVLDGVAVILAVALQGRARVEAIAAGLLMFMGWPLAYS
jgi:hypothetical protein